MSKRSQDHKEVALPLDEPQYQDILRQLRNMPEFAQLFQFVSFFKKMLRVNEEVNIEVIEEELIGVALPTAFLHTLLMNLLLILSHVKRTVTEDTLDAAAWEVYSQHNVSPNDNPFGVSSDPDDLEHFDSMSPQDKIRVLHQLVHWVVIAPNFREKFDKLLAADPDTLPQAFRIDPVGWKGEFGTYYLLDDNRLYFFQDQPPDLSQVDPQFTSGLNINSKNGTKEPPKEKKPSIVTQPDEEIKTPSPSSSSTKKRRREPLTAVARKRRAIAANKRKKALAAAAALEKEAAVDKENEDESKDDNGNKSDTELEDKINEETPHYISLSEALSKETPESELIWSCVCVTLSDWEEFIANLKHSKNQYDRQFYSYLNKELLPVLQSFEESRIAAAKARLKNREKQVLVVNRKRSSRLEERATRANREEENNKQVEFIMAEETRMKEREKRLKLRDERREKEKAEREAKAAAKAAKLAAKLAFKNTAAAATPTATPTAAPTASVNSNSAAVIAVVESVDSSATQSKASSVRSSRSTSPATSASTRHSTRSSSRLLERHLANKVLGTPKTEEPIFEKSKNVVPPENEHWTFDCYCGIHGEDYDDGTPVVACGGCEIWLHVGCLHHSEYERLQIATENEQKLKERRDGISKEVTKKEEDGTKEMLKEEPEEKSITLVSDDTLSLEKGPEEDLSTEFLCDRCVRIRTYREKKLKREARLAEIEAAKAAVKAERRAEREKAKVEARAQAKAEAVEQAKARAEAKAQAKQEAKMAKEQAKQAKNEEKMAKAQAKLAKAQAKAQAQAQAQAKAQAKAKSKVKAQAPVVVATQIQGQTPAFVQQSAPQYIGGPAPNPSQFVQTYPHSAPIAQYNTVPATVSTPYSLQAAASNVIPNTSPGGISLNHSVMSTAATAVVAAPAPSLPNTSITTTLMGSLLAAPESLSSSQLQQLQQIQQLQQPQPQPQPQVQVQQPYSGQGFSINPGFAITVPVAHPQVLPPQVPQAAFVEPAAAVPMVPGTNTTLTDPIHPGPPNGV
ncbi:uncharacterized protein SAPINGB_P001198 [Magnusiomyces paraingens]|uniref:Zinc finger PHD-type domain-containing protein n=1 Tax=Magnusiomyces paraingens TaxID=2606893 RepID=A0A5E8B6A7_9ASCO|nr:uncharacterized protein SAPINGB_P001198 [Saprochaete ingens]VVT46407.1 unnamed protein product [Saprochaete ingens]